VCFDSWRQLFQLDAQEPRVFRHMKDTVAILGTHDDLVAGPLQELAPPAVLADQLLPCDLWLTRQLVGGGQGKQPQGKYHRHPDRSPPFLGEMA
jgi:hypothetical protein